jgi:hypothetical protein
MNLPTAFKVITPNAFIGSSLNIPWIPALRDPQGREHRRTAKSMRGMTLRDVENGFKQQSA